MAKTKLNPLTDKPQNLTDITQDFMLEYMRKVATATEEKEWFKKLCNDNVDTKVNNLTKEEVKVIKLKVVRKAFAERYFPTLVKAKKKGATFLDLVNNL